MISTPARFELCHRRATRYFADSTGISISQDCGNSTFSMNCNRNPRLVMSRTVQLTAQSSDNRTRARCKTRLRGSSRFGSLAALAPEASVLSRFDNTACNCVSCSALSYVHRRFPNMGIELSILNNNRLTLTEIDHISPDTAGPGRPLKIKQASS